MADRTEQARTRRNAARDRRRSRVAEPFEELDRAVQDSGDEATSRANGQLAGTAAKVVGTAVAAGLLGALGGAAKALLDRRGGDGSSGSSTNGEDEPEATAEPPAPEPSAPEHEDDGEEDEQPRSEQVAEREPDSTEADAEEEGRPQVKGVSGGEAAEIVARARQQLEALLGTEAERVSGLERADGSWYVMLEVVEVARIPESTDVLATYELVLDDEKNLASVTRRRRYRRSQIDESS